MKEFIKKLIGRLEEYCKPDCNGCCSHCHFTSALGIVNQLAEEYKDTNVSTIDAGELLGNGWIPCSERLPEKRDWYLAVFQEVDTGFTGLPFIADYLMGSHTNLTTEDGWIIANCTDIEEDRAEYYKKLKCVAWQPLPEPYQPKGE